MLDSITYCGHMFARFCHMSALPFDKQHIDISYSADSWSVHDQLGNQAQRIKRPGPRCFPRLVNQFGTHCSVHYLTRFCRCSEPLQITSRTYIPAIIKEHRAKKKLSKKLFLMIRPNRFASQLAGQGSDPDNTKRSSVGHRKFRGLKKHVKTKAESGPQRPRWCSSHDEDDFADDRSGKNIIKPSTVLCDQKRIGQDFFIIVFGLPNEHFRLVTPWNVWKFSKNRPGKSYGKRPNNNANKNHNNKIRAVGKKAEKNWPSQYTDDDRV